MSTGMLRPAVKHGDKIYKAAPGHPHDEALPRHLRDTMDEKQQDYEEAGMKTGYINHKGQFLDHRAAMSYAKEHDLIRPELKSHASKTSNLTSDMLSSSFAFR